ncbi:MAG: hypothetical protein P4M15_03390 [Alphaproteobacteria bacterium]|nr:hypothetical protein [Alphaproteobacteria bacterium]
MAEPRLVPMLVAAADMVQVVAAWFMDPQQAMGAVTEILGLAVLTPAVLFPAVAAITPLTHPVAAVPVAWRS